MEPIYIKPLHDVEREHILNAYVLLNKHKTNTAKNLGIGLSTLQRKFKKWGIK